ncbi:DUF6153 family protein [Nocardia niwae]|uniref:DUF6153 family protein n=1 Tax=Nocardia niwae TaxID=626084 RepID=UPI000A9B86F4|nr:DUF6153 family protein [Nocardia niwae]
MVDHRRLRAAGMARLLGVLALLAGVVAMHSVVFGAAGHTHAGPHTASAFEATSAVPERAAAARHTSGHDSAGRRAPGAFAADTAAPRGAGHELTTKLLRCDGGGCDGAHSALHSCVFILVASLAVAALVLLYRMAADRPGGGAARPRHWRARRERPPPWTVLTLAELAILRI